MQVGTGVIFQNPDRAMSDRSVYENELRLGDLVEPLGFDALWGVEHHFTDYTMCPDVLQYLAYFAGRTKKITLGSMVVVLPWHSPIRAAEEIAMLDNMCGGRFILGIGRGLGRIEFDGLGIPMGESRERFVEAAEIILTGLDRGWCEYDGKFYKQEKRDIRPEPTRPFKGRVYAAAVSPESSRIMAKLGVGILIIPQKPWNEVAQELDAYRTIYREVNGSEAPPTICAGWVFCDEDPKRAEAMARKYIGGYYDSVMKHYEIFGDHLKQTKGYEYYAEKAELVKAAGKAATDMALEMFLQVQFWGTPDQIYEKILRTRALIGCDTFSGVFSYAGMPYDEAERNMRLFAEKVMPRLKALPTCAEEKANAA